MGRVGPERMSLETMARRGLLPTPTVQDAENCGGPSQARRNTPPLNSIAGGPLNPQFVEWMMGFPLGWTALEPSEMPSSRKSSKKSAARS